MQKDIWFIEVHLNLTKIYLIDTFCIVFCFGRWMWVQQMRFDPHVTSMFESCRATFESEGKPRCSEAVQASRLAIRRREVTAGGATGDEQRSHGRIICHGHGMRRHGHGYTCQTFIVGYLWRITNLPTCFERTIDSDFDNPLEYWNRAG